MEQGIIEQYLEWGDFAQDAEPADPRKKERRTYPSHLDTCLACAITWQKDRREKGRRYDDEN